jgi:hypothetical protein
VIVRIFATPSTVRCAPWQRVYPIRSKKETWYLSSFDVPVSFLNTGAQPLLIKGCRLRLHFLDIPIPKNAELIPVDWEIVQSDAEKITKHRFEWMEMIAPKEFMPFVVLSKQTVVKHSIFETRWDDPVIQDRVRITMESYSSTNRTWQKGETWDVSLQKEVWADLANAGGSFSYPSPALQTDEERRTPADLHKYTGTREEIPSTGFNAPTSYLNYRLEKDS